MTVFLRSPHPSSSSYSPSPSSSPTGSKYGLDDAPKDVVAMVSHATQERLKTIVEKLAVISDHRLEIIKVGGEAQTTL